MLVPRQPQFRKFTLLLCFAAFAGLAGIAAGTGMLAKPDFGKGIAPVLQTRVGRNFRRLTRFLRTIAPADWQQREIHLVGGEQLRGKEINYWTRLDSLRQHDAATTGLNDLQLLDGDGHLRLLRATSADGVYREVTSQQDWTNYSGDNSGNRHSPLTEVTPANVGQLNELWTHAFDSNVVLSTTPVVAGGILYATSWNEVYALDAGTGRELWHFRRPRTEGYVMTKTGPSRGAAVAGDSVFLMSDHAHLISLNRFTGDVRWEIEVADWHDNYYATMAPMTVSGMVITGISGGDEGVRGFVAAFDQQTGECKWRFWTVPDAGQPGSETWGGMPAEHSGAATWLTGSYDPESNTIYWSTGNPGSDYNGTIRPGDNLYSDSVVALDADTGQLRWHFQFTPHDVWDWDATQPLVLADAAWNGKPRKLLMQANRNGFFYVLDRVTGEFLHASPFIDRITWAAGIGRDGRPTMVPGQLPTPEGTRICPMAGGATNFYPSSYNTASGLFYVVASEQCGIFRSEEVEEWEAGKNYEFGSSKIIPEDGPARFLRALDIRTGRRVWEVPLAGDSWSRNGVLTTASGLAFLGEVDRSFTALDARTGARLWSAPMDAPATATPITFTFDGHQQVVIANANKIHAFGLAASERD